MEIRRRRQKAPAALPRSRSASNGHIRANPEVRIDCPAYFEIGIGKSRAVSRTGLRASASFAWWVMSGFPLHRQEPDRRKATHLAHQPAGGYVRFRALDFGRRVTAMGAEPSDRSWPKSVCLLAGALRSEAGLQQPANATAECPRRTES
jgi:hypothetical protein